MELFYTILLVEKMCQKSSLCAIFPMAGKRPTKMAILSPPIVPYRQIIRQSVIRPQKYLKKPKLKLIYTHIMNNLHIVMNK